MNVNSLAPRLLIIDDLLNITHKDCRTTTRILTLGIESDVARKFLISQIPDCTCTTVIDHAEYAEQAQEWVRDFYFNEFSNVASHLVKDILQKGGDARYLAYLKFFERTPFDGNLATCLYWLALVKLIKESISPSRVDVVIRHDVVFREVFTGKSNRRFQWTPALGLVLQLARFFLLYLRVFWSPWSKRNSSVSRSPSESLFFTIYPHWWVSYGSQGKSDRFFPEQVLASKGNEARYLIWFQSRSYRKDLQALKGQLKIDFLVLNDYVKFRDFLVILKRVRRSRVLNFLRSSAPFSKVTFQSFDISGLIEQALVASVAKGEFVQSHLVEMAMYRICKDRKPDHVIFRFENQPLDHAIIEALHELSDTVSVGYWHTALSLSQNYIPLWQISSFWERTGLSDMNKGPWPDFMLVPNELCKKTLQREGFSSDDSFQILPTRHIELLTSRFVTLQSDANTNEFSGTSAMRILVSFSADKETSLLLASTALRCLVSMEGSYQVGIRPHPAWTFDFSEVEQLSSFATDSLLLHVIWDMKEMYEWISQSEVLVTPGSQLALESIFLGTLPIVFEPKSVFNPTDFNAFSRSCLLVSDLESLESALVKVITQDSSIQSVMSNWAELMNAFLGVAPRRAVKVDPEEVMAVVSRIRFSHD